MKKKEIKKITKNYCQFKFDKNLNLIQSKSCPELDNLIKKFKKYRKNNKPYIYRIKFSCGDGIEFFDYYLSFKRIKSKKQIDNFVQELYDLFKDEKNFTLIYFMYIGRLINV